MAIEERRTSGGNGFLYFVVGALVIGVAVLAYIMLSGQPRTAEDDALGRAADSIGDAADSISDSARDAARNMPQVPAPQPAPAPTPAPVPATPPQ